MKKRMGPKEEGRGGNGVKRKLKGNGRESGEREGRGEMRDGRGGEREEEEGWKRREGRLGRGRGKGGEGWKRKGKGRKEKGRGDWGGKGEEGKGEWETLPETSATRQMAPLIVAAF